jgi:hypothetical protein
LSDLATPLRIKLSCASSAALDATLPAPLYSGGAFAIILPILDLPRGNIDDQLAELDRVARAFETAGCHVGNMAWQAPIGNPGDKGAPNGCSIRTDRVSGENYGAVGLSIGTRVSGPG